MAVVINARGTSNQAFQISKGGPKLVNNSGILEIRSVNDELQRIQADEPTSASDLTTKGYVDTLFSTFELVSDTTPQLGGDLDVNGNSIISASNGDIKLIPNGTGLVIAASGYDMSSGPAYAFTTKEYVDTKLDLTGPNTTVVQGVEATDAVNYVQITNAATTTSPRIEAVGTDTNIDLTIAVKGDGAVFIEGSSTDVLLESTSADASSNNSGGNLAINTGTGDGTGDGGSVIITPGSGGTSGVSGNIVLNGTVTRKRRTTTSTISTLKTDYIVLVNATSVTITLSTVSKIDGNELIIKDITGAETPNITIDTEDSALIDGQSSIIIDVAYDVYHLVCDGSNWFIL
jgi:hypothetical protein